MMMFALSIDDALLMLGVLLVLFAIELAVTTLVIAVVKRDASPPTGYVFGPAMVAGVLAGEVSLYLAAATDSDLMGLVVLTGIAGCAVAGAATLLRVAK